MKKKNKAVKITKPMTKSQVIAELVERTELSKANVVSVLDNLLNLSYEQAYIGFTIHGLGKLVIVDRKARMGRNPATGEKIRIKAKKVLKFRLSKIAKDAVI